MEIDLHCELKLAYLLHWTRSCRTPKNLQPDAQLITTISHNLAACALCCKFPFPTTCSELSLLQVVEIFKFKLVGIQYSQADYKKYSIRANVFHVRASNMFCSAQWNLQQTALVLMINLKGKQKLFNIL